MSWQEYVDQHLIATGKVSKAAIIGLEGTTWATSSGFAVTPEEAKTVVSSIGNDLTCFQANGVYLAGTKYTYLQGVPGQHIYGKKGDCGCCIVMTKKAVIIGIYETGVQPGAATMVIEKLGDYLKDVGY